MSRRTGSACSSPSQAAAWRCAFCLLAVAAVWAPRSDADPYVTPASVYRWNSASGIRFNDVGGIRFNDAGGIRFNDVGGIRFNDAGGLLFTEASGIRFNDVGGIRFNDAGGIRFNDAGTGTSVDLQLLDLLPTLADTSSINVVVSYLAYPSSQDLNRLGALGITGGTLMRMLPMVVVTATRSQIVALAGLPNVRSVWADRALTWVADDARRFIGVNQSEQDPFLRGPQGLPFAGRGVAIAFVDTGIDATHPDLPAGTKVVQNTRVETAAGIPGVFVNPVYTEGIANTDLALGHGTFGAGIAAGTGAASGGLYRGVAAEAKLVGVSVGDIYIVNVLEGYDYVLWRGAQYGIRVVNCSFSTSGPFDPDDPINMATRELYDRGLTVVFAAGNYGPAPDTLNPYAVAPWVIGVASGDTAGRLSSFSSRGVLNEGLYHPTLTAPGERIISTSSVSLQGVFGIAGAPAGSDAAVLPAYRWAYSEASGTSFAAPHVAGVAALMLEADPTLTPAEIKQLLQISATPMPARDRGEVGTGYLDAWAALTKLLDPARPFGSFIPELLDRRRYELVFGPIVEFSGTVPAGGELTLPLPGGVETLSVTAGIAWDAPADDLDMVVLGPGGSELARSASINAGGIFGTSEGFSLYHPGAPATLRIFPKIGLASDLEITGQYQTIEPFFPRLDDLNTLAPQDRGVALKALASLAMSPRPGTSDGGRFPWREPRDADVPLPPECFCGSSLLTRGEAARLIALAAHVPQTLPGAPSFIDVPPTDPAYAYIESVATSAARRGVMLPPRQPLMFGSKAGVERIELAVAAIEALGLHDEAAAWSGQLQLADLAQVPAGTEGHAALALALGILRTTPTPAGEALLPRQAITRLDAARAVVAMLAFTR